MGKEKEQDQKKSITARILITICIILWKTFLIVLLVVIRFLVVLLNLIGEKIETYLNIKKPK